MAGHVGRPEVIAERIRHLLDQLRRARARIDPFQPPSFLRDVESAAAYVTGYEPRTWIFVLEYASRGSGGLADVVHLGEELQARHGWRVFYHVCGEQTHDSAIDAIRWTDNRVSPDRVLQGIECAPEIVCATAWPTAYLVRSIPSFRKLYFVQDYEPWFHRRGVQHEYAAKSYSLGLEIFTLGDWLPRQIEKEHGVKAFGMPYPLSDPIDPEPSWEKRRKVAVYLQPDKEHRGAGLLLTACRAVAENLAREGLELEFFGSRQNEWLAIDFPGTLRGILTRQELAVLMKSARAAVFSSFTNVSLLPIRFLANGACVVEANFPAVMMNMPCGAGDWFRTVDPLPNKLARAITQACFEHPGPYPRKVMENYWRGHSWPVCADRVAGWVSKQQTSGTLQVGSPRKR